MSVRVGIVDGGVGTVAPECLAASARFVTDHDGDVDMIRETHLGPALRHGELVAALVLAAAPTAILIDARVASATGRPTARSVAAAIDWCVAEGARIVNLSLGLVDDRAVLRDACARALAGGVTLIAAAPARGAAVYPAGYPGVLSVCGDARCADAQWSLLGGVTGTEASSEATAGRDGSVAFGAGFGACPHAPDGTARGGASMAAARFTGHVAALFAHGTTSMDELNRYLAAGASWRGRENRRVVEVGA